MRLHAENPDLSYEEVIDLAMRTSSRPFREDEARYEYECRSCGDPMWIGQESHDRYQNNKKTGQGFTIPKCGACWV